MINGQKRNGKSVSGYYISGDIIKKRRQNWLFTFRFLFTAAAFIICILIWINMRMKIVTESFPFTESSRQLRNPNRGFYGLYRFFITEDDVDYRQLVKETYRNDQDTKLTHVQICLQAYKEGAIGEKGLANIEELFCELETLDKQLIVRFTYDQEGQNELYEPESLDIILQHMRQLEPILKGHNSRIFVVQGFFTGNWGEMNGTRYNSDEDLQKLAAQLAAVTDESTYLAVRMPAQWRRIMNSNTLSEMLSGRLCLFNDGMLGNESDYGTYRPENVIGEDPLQRKYPEEELEFQKNLCCTVPNGGEVIHDNTYNDFENAIAGLSERRITYLNKDYDPAVFDKWRKTSWKGEDCFRGMDGYTYIERHLGYRLFISNASIEYKEAKSSIDVEVSLRNVGFAPLYKKAKAELILYHDEFGQCPPVNMRCDVQKLMGGDDTEEVAAAYAKLPVSELQRGNYEMYFYMEDADTGEEILMANEEEEEEYGYHIGMISVQ